MIDFMYLGTAKINSNDLVDLLELCQEYILPQLKQALEQVFIGNISLDSFLDIYLVAKAFECTKLRERLLEFGRANVQ